jgi:replication-associated recombination protein RarA
VRYQKKLNLHKYFERLREKVIKNNNKKNNEIAIATSLDPVDSPLSNAPANSTEHFMLSQQEDKFLDEVIGYFDIKRLFRMAIDTIEPVHILLIGPPASAKTVFMRSMMKLPSSYFTDGSNTTKAGRLDYIFENKPKYILIDEIDKMQYKDQAFLLNLMETGIISETKHQKTRIMEIKTWIFASSNNTNNISPALRSRFFPIKLEPYSYRQFCEITQRLLVHNGIHKEVARATADAVWYKIKSGNIRDCVRIARMAKSIEDVNFIVSTYLKYDGDANGVSSS